MKDFEENLKNKIHFFEEALRSFTNMHRADPAMLHNIKIQLSFGTQDLKKIASIVANVNNRELRVTPFDSENLKPIAAALTKADLGNVTDLKNEILISLRPMTQDYKKKIFEEVKKLAHETKEKIRQERQNFLNKLKTINIEDEKKRKEKEMQNLVDKNNKHVEELLENFQKKVIA